MNPKQLLQCPPASLFKQLISMLYDSLLIAALLFFAFAILLPFNEGEAVSGPAYSFYLLMVVFIFYAWFWNKAGQTLGMKVWKIRIINEYGYNPSWTVAFIRLSLAVAPALGFLILNHYFKFATDSRNIAIIAAVIFLSGYLWRLFMPYTWHDRLSQTKIIDVSSIQVNRE